MIHVGLCPGNGGFSPTSEGEDESLSCVLLSRGGSALVALALVAVSVGGCVEGTDPPPNVVGDDAEEAAASIEDAGYTAAFDPDRDPAGCTVESQDDDGETVTLTLDCAQADWEAREGEDWEAFTAGFVSGFEDGCNRLFDLSPDGSLYNADTEYTADDCLTLNPGEDAVEESGADIPTEVPGDPDSAGAEQGMALGCAALFESEGIDALYHGEEEFTADDCESGRAPAPPVPQPPRRQGNGEEDCGSIPFSGVQTKIIVLRGVDCQTALSVAREYERGTAPAPWGCFIGREGEQNKLACGAGPGQGDVTKRPRAFVGR